MSICWSGLSDEIAFSKSLIEIGLEVLVMKGLMSSRSGTRKLADVSCSGSLVRVTDMGVVVMGGIGFEVLLFLFLFSCGLGCFFLQKANRSSIRVISTSRMVVVLLSFPVSCGKERRVELSCSTAGGFV